MIRIQAHLDNGEMKIHAVGHANFTEHGKNNVCAGVSTIMHTVLLTIQAIAQQDPEHFIVEILSEEGEETE